MILFRVAAVAIVLGVGPAFAGHTAPSFIDGGQSADGRFTVVAEAVGKTTDHGPNRWRFVRTDTKTGKSTAFDAAEVQSGQIYGQLLVAPDGETFALWNHVTLWSDTTSGKSPEKPGHDLADPAFSRRIIVYKKDGTVLKSLGLADLLTPEEWADTLVVFNRAHWCEDYPGLSYRRTPRPGYAFYRVSPDYTVLEARIAPPRASRAKGPRIVRIDLTSGTVIPPDAWPKDTDKVPVRPFRGPDALETEEKNGREQFVPSLDPVRQEGTLPTLAEKPAEKPAASSGKLELVQGGYKKADTPAWLPSETCLLFTDLEANALYRLDPPGKIAVALEGAGRGKVGPDGRWYGMVNGALASWKPGEKTATVILDKSPDGRPWEVNDIAVTSKFAYLTTLKDPEKGRLTVVNLEKKTGVVAFDGEKDADLVNPNGVAVSADGKSLFVGISSYKDRKKSCVYRFPVGDDGMPDVAEGKKKRFADVSAPDGIAAGRDGTVYFTAGGVVKVVGPDGKSRPDLKIPKGSGTNVTLGGPDGRTLYVTTFEALYACPLGKE